MSIRGIEESGLFDKDNVTNLAEISRLHMAHQAARSATMNASVAHLETESLDTPSWDVYARVDLREAALLGLDLNGDCQLVDTRPENLFELISNAALMSLVDDTHHDIGMDLDKMVDDCYQACSGGANPSDTALYRTRNRITSIVRQAVDVDRIVKNDQSDLSYAEKVYQLTSRPQPKTQAPENAMNHVVKNRLQSIVNRTENQVGTHEDFTGEAITSTIGDYSPEAAQNIQSLSAERRSALYEDIRRTAVTCTALYNEQEDLMIADGMLSTHQNYSEYLKSKLDAYFDQ
jgi:hypothetical protein